MQRADIDRRTLDEVLRLKEAVESTLMELREMLNRLENPFSYITSLLEDLRISHAETRREHRARSKDSRAAESSDLKDVVKIEEPGQISDESVLTRISELQAMGRDPRLGVEFLTAFLSTYIALKHLGFDEDMLESMLNTLHSYGLISKRVFKLYIASLNMLTEVVDYRESDVFQILNVLSLALRLAGYDEISRAVSLIVRACRPYEIVVV